MKIIIYESPMCCSSGCCGPNLDQNLINFEDILEIVKKSGAEIERYSVNQSPEKFREHPEVLKLVQEQQLKALPITTCNGKIVKCGAYPTLEEFQKFISE